MYLTPKEIERLTIFTAAEIARRRKAKSIKLNVKEITLVALGENRRVIGLNNLTNGALDNPETKDRAIANAQQTGYMS